MNAAIEIVSGEGVSSVRPRPEILQENRNSMIDREP